MLITDTPVDTFDKVSLDTVGKLPTTPDSNKHILTMQDNLSKYCIAVPIITDRGGSFINNLLRKLSKKLWSNTDYHFRV